METAAIYGLGFARLGVRFMDRNNLYGRLTSNLCACQISNALHPERSLICSLEIRQLCSTAPLSLPSPGGASYRSYRMFSLPITQTLDDD